MTILQSVPSFSHIWPLDATWYYISKAGGMSLRKIKEKYGLSTLAVAAIACVEASKAYLMESNRCLDVRDVALILRSLSLVRGQGYD